MKKKKILLLLITIFSTLIFSNTIYASEGSIQTLMEYSKVFDESIEPQYEKVRWYYRTVNGKKQKRLWSLTAGEWLTDWQWV
ncbi:hypothetical protein KQI41_06195 [Tissierella pigra]|uniref:Uncharacterized protein n=1 Tax=Tissierella pigra TaxID=2607614 RepID=A0A6N7XSA1_9FIRM|nr:hypothetical protein [Tissierella pigra]MBU5426002.1 hypothetical protein [Tissierella pigra]MSU00637.1 hypothetical protein [Tissierella pigra]